MNPTQYKDTVLFGDAYRQLQGLPDQIVQMCVTSPPYWGLRDYQTGTWKGGDDDCKHVKSTIRKGVNLAESEKSTKGGAKKIADVPTIKYTSKCEKCGAIREDFQIGLEETIDEYISRLVLVFREVKRVLKDNGTLWLNIGDSYSGSGKAGQSGSKTSLGWRPDYPNKHIVPEGLKRKELCMIPARLAMALQADGWYLRSDIIWSKPNCMPESVKDRPTKSHEYIFLLTKSEKYYYDFEAISEPIAESTKLDPRWIERNFTEKRPDRNYPKGQQQNGSGMLKGYGSRRNKRSVWEISLKPYSEAHFAVYPPQLPATCIKAGSRKGDIILDPFFGSGTTGEVALRLGRHYLGIDLDKSNQSLIHKRIQPHKQDLFYESEK